MYKIKSEPLKIALISLHGDTLWGRSLHYYNPLSVTTLSGYLKHKRQNIDIKIFDTLLHSCDEIGRELLEYAPHITGISMKTDSLIELRTIMKKIPPSKILLGGIAPTVIYSDLLNEFPECYIIRGEGEYPFLKFIEYAKGKISLCDVPNLVYKKDTIIENTLYNFDLSCEEFQPSDDFTGECIKRGGDFWLESSRGCRMNCSFCSKTVARSGITGHRRFPLRRTLERIKEINKKFGIKKFRFADEDFFNDDFNFIEDFCSGVMELPFDFKFEIDVTVRGIYSPEEPDEKKLKRRILWEKMKQAGLSHVFIGIESLSNSQLKRYRKVINVENIEEALACLDIPYVAGFIPFDPFVTTEELKENFTNLKRTGIVKHINTPIKFMRVQRKTDMAEMVKDAGLITGLTDNGMCYKYRFQQGDVEKICAVITRKARIFNVYGPRIGYMIRPEGGYSDKLEKDMLSYLSEKTCEFKNLELDFLISLTENHDGNLEEIEEAFTGIYITLYTDILKKSDMIGHRDTGAKIKEVCEDFLREMNRVKSE
ncbi:MAG: radical SAM protein [Candidatus Eremiobacterota bacterium]